MKLSEYLPEPCYNGEPHTRLLQDAVDGELRALWGVRDDFAAQLFLDTATWGLDAWEKVFGLEKEYGRSDRQRRDRIAGKFLAAGTTTEQLVRKLAERSAGCEARVLTYPEEYRFRVSFLDMGKNPAELWALCQALDELKPAHLSYDFLFSWLVSLPVEPRCRSPRLAVRGFLLGRELPEALWLDGGWELGGEAAIDGWKRYGEDYYPASMGIRTSLRETVGLRAGGRGRLSYAAGFNMGASGALAARAGAAVSVGAASGGGARSGIRVISAAESALTAEKELWLFDGRESFDGTRNFDGGDRSETKL